MGIMHFCRTRQKVLVRCTHCYFEDDLSPEEVYRLERENRNDPLCSVKEECDICHIGFMIPVNYTDKTGKTYRFHEIKPLIQPLDPTTVMERIWAKADQVLYIGPTDNFR
jgi:hypothetical protein